MFALLLHLKATEMFRKTAIVQNQINIPPVPPTLATAIVSHQLFTSLGAQISGADCSRYAELGGPEGLADDLVAIFTEAPFC